MYHTLKTLWEWAAKHNPDLVSRFRHLADYCQEADQMQKPKTGHLNRGHKSLKWLIYSLRDKLSEDELRQVFYYTLIECAVYSEEYLYNDVFVTKIAREHRHLLEKPEFNPEDYPIHQIGKWRVLVNETPANLTNLVFKRNVADIYVFRNAEKGWAGIVFDERSPRNVLAAFDIPAIFAALARRNEPWIMIGKNLIICGGPKAPENKTGITIPEMLKLLGS